MNAIDLLKEDHRVVDALFYRIEKTPPSEHPAIFSRIKGELDTHAHIEETIFYPAIKRKGKKDLKDIVAEGIEEHAQIKKFLGEIARGRSEEKREAKLKVLMEDTRHHVKEEEKEMFPMCEDQIDEETLEKLGVRMEREKVKFQKAEGITPENRDDYKGVVATVIDKAKAVLSSITGADDETSNGAEKPAAKGTAMTTPGKSGKGRAPKSSTSTSPKARGTSD